MSITGDGRFPLNSGWAYRAPRVGTRFLSSWIAFGNYDTAQQAMWGDWFGFTSQTTVNATLSVTLDATTLTATATTGVNATLSVLLANLSLLATAAVTAGPVIVPARGGPRYRPVGEFDFKTLRAEFRKSGEERVVLEEVIEAAEVAIEDNTRVAGAVELAREIKRMHDMKLSEARIRNLITSIRRDAAFKAETERVKRQLEDDEDEDESLLILFH